MLKNIGLSNLPKLSSPKYIVFNSLVKVLNTLSDDSFSYPENEIQEVMDVESLHRLASKYGKSINFSYFQNFAEFTTILITKALEEYDESTKLIILNDILEYTFFSSNESWNITNLCRKYDLEPFDFFYSMVKNAIPYGMGFFSHTKQNNCYEAIKKQYDEAMSADYAHFDYWNGIGIKCNFPRDAYNDNTPFILNMRRFNERNDNLGYEKIIQMLSTNIQKRKSDFKLYIKNLTDSLKLDKMIICNSEQINKFNSITSRDLDKTQKYYNDIIVNKKQNYFNHRDIYTFEKKPWKHMMSDSYDFYVKDELVFCELANLIKYEYDNFTINYSYDTNSISIVNMLIYGKTNVNQYILNLVLGLIRCKITKNVVQLDNYVIEKYLYESSNGPSYNILWQDDNIYELGFPKTNEEKREVCSNLINLMNEVEPEYLNFHNYFQVVKWYEESNFIKQIDWLVNTIELDSKQKKELLSCFDK